VSYLLKRSELLRLVLDTTIIVAAFRSRSGASRRMLELLVEGRFILVATPALFFEYESVLSRSEQVGIHGFSQQQIGFFLDTLARFTEIARVSYRWRPQLRDPDDEFVLEAAINGFADAIITFNTGDFLPVTNSFGIEAMRPGSIIRERFNS
jgi:putative PIN family toxin of toxin-antitoxin system